MHYTYLKTLFIDIDNSIRWILWLYIEAIMQQSLSPNIQYWEIAPAVSDKLEYKEGAW